MEIYRKAKLLRIFIGENSKCGSTPVYEKIVLEAKKRNLAGATVYRGIMGFGKNSRIHSSKILTLSTDMPLVIEIVDEIELIEPFAEYVSELFEDSNSGGLVTIEQADVIKYTSTK